MVNRVVAYQGYRPTAVHARGKLGQNPSPDKEATTTYFAMIPKSGGNTSAPDGWRYIALMSYVSKVYDKMILNRISPIIDPLLRTEQNGFRKKRSTLQQVMQLKLIYEEIQYRKNQQGVFLFVDYSNAFPSVSVDAIKAALKAFHVPQFLIDAILKMYSGHQGIVRNSDGLSAPFNITAGVLQGDTLAPFLFDLVLDCILRKTLSHCNTNGLQFQTHIHDLDFADDIVLICGTAHEAQKRLIRLAKLSRHCGLEINLKKTKFMLLGCHKPAVIKIGNIHLEQVTDYKYLGVYLSTQKDIRMRLAQAWQATTRLTPVWKSPALSESGKIRLWRSMIEPIITYGGPAWTLTQKLQQTLCGSTTRMLRFIRGLPGDAHIALEDIYGVTLSATAIDMPQIATTICVRQLSLLQNTFKNFPDHNIFRLLQMQPVAPRKAARQTFLKDLIATRIGCSLSQFNFQLLTTDFIHDRAQLVEQTIYDRVARLAHGRKLHHITLALLDQLPPYDDDTPLQLQPRAQYLSIRTSVDKLKWITNNFPHLLPQPPPQQFHNNQQHHHQQQQQQQQALNQLLVPTRKISRYSFVQVPFDEFLHPTFCIASSPTKASIATQDLPHLDRTIHLAPATQIESELQAVINILREFLHTPVRIDLSNQSILTKISKLARHYFQRLLRKHVLWKTIFLLLRNRSHKVEFSHNLPSLATTRSRAIARL